MTSVVSLPVIGYYQLNILIVKTGDVFNGGESRARSTKF